MTYDQNATGGTAAANEHFGEGLGFVAGVSERTILVGVPDDVNVTGGVVNVIQLPGGSTRSPWQPGGGAPDRFGSAVVGEVQQ